MLSTMSLTFEHDPGRREFHVSADGDMYTIPELDEDHRTRWLRRVAREVTNVLAEIERQDHWLNNMNAQWDGVAGLIDLIMAYDRDGHLPSRAWLEEHLTVDQPLEIVQTIQAVHA